MTLAKPVAEAWYGVEEIEPDVLRVREAHIHPYFAGDIWVLRGTRRTLVFDTGTGIVPPMPFVATLCDRPILAVVSCWYYDHAGGLRAFPERACHPLEAAMVAAAPAPTDFQGIGDDHLSALPRAGFSCTGYVHRGCEPTVLLEDGDVLELGGRSLEVLHIPGRTPGSLALFDRRDGLLLGGETAFLDPDGHDFPPEHVGDYERSLRRLAALPVRRVLGGHHGAFGPEGLARLLDEEIGRYDTPAGGGR